MVARAEKSERAARAWHGGRKEGRRSSSRWRRTTWCDLVPWMSVLEWAGDWKVWDVVVKSHVAVGGGSYLCYHQFGWWNILKLQTLLTASHCQCLLSAQL